MYNCIYIYNLIYLEGNDIGEHRLMSCSCLLRRVAYFSHVCPSTALCFLRSQSSVIGAPDSIFSATQSRGLGDCDMSNHHQFHGTRQVGRKKSSKSRSFAKNHLKVARLQNVMFTSPCRENLGAPTSFALCWAFQKKPSNRNPSNWIAVKRLRPNHTPHSGSTQL